MITRVTIATVLAFLVFAGPGPALGQDAHGLGLYAVGGSLGYVKPSDFGGTLGFGLRADIGEFGRGFVLFPEVGYWSVTAERTDYYGDSVKTRELTLALNAHYYLNPQDRISYYIGAGAGLFNSKVTAESDILGRASDLDSQSSLGLQVLGGAERPVGAKARMFGELRYKVDGTIDLLQILVGLTIEVR